MNDEFIRNAMGNGEEGAQWLKKIPDIIKAYEEKWVIKVSAPFHLSYNYVAPAVRPDGAEVVLKIGFPKDREFRTELEALAVFDGKGAEKLLEADEANAVMLIERVVPGTPLSAMEDDEAATRIVASVMKKLWKPLPDKHNFIPINELLEAIDQYQAKFNNKKGPIPMELIEKALRLSKELIATSARPMLVHGDLHHDNILRSERAGWLAIDPKGIAAEPAYEVGAMMRNPYLKMKDQRDPKSILTRRIMILSKELDIEPRRILQWSFVHTILSAAWNTEGSKGPEHAVRIAEALNQISVQ